MVSGDPATVGNADGVDPATVHTLSELAVAFQRLRGSRSYTDLDKAINPNHRHQGPRLLPPSTLNNLLHGKSTPTQETVVRYLTACGLDEGAQESWLTVWERVTTVHLRRPTGAVRVREARPRLLGVHASIQVDGAHGELPTYIPRDLDAGLRTALKAVAECGGIVLLVGGSSVGKTRTLFEAVRAVLPEWWLIHPEPADSDSVRVVANAPTPRTVVWLDELQRYLDAPVGLPVGLVRGLIGAGTVLVATLWPYEYISRTQRPVPGEPDLRANDRDLLGLSQVVDVPDTFSAAEWCRAEALASDRRIRIALDSADAGLTQVLAAGPELVRWWENASDPYGKAVITAALDARRVGANAPLTRSLLEAAAAGYVSERKQATAPGDWLDHALGYAITELHGAAFALCPAPAGMGRATGYTVADYLHQHAGRTRRTTPLPDAAWWALIDHHQPEDALRLAEAARNRALHRHAESLYRAAAESGEPRGLTGLAELRMEQGKQSEAFILWQEAAVAGDFNGWKRMIDILERQGHLDQALAVLCDAEAGGLDGALNWRAHLLSRAGREEEAEGAWRQAIAHGDLNARIGLADMLQELGRPDEAEQVWQREIDAGVENSRSGLAGLFKQQGRIDEAITALQDGLAAGDDPYAWSWLADLLERQGRIDEAIEAGCEAINLGEDINAWSRMARIFIEHNRVDEGIEFATEGLELGYEEAAEVLAGLLGRQGRVDEAAEVWTDRIARRDPYARGHLARLLLDQQRSDEAERVLQEAVTAGDPYACSGLARFLQDQGRIEEAILTWQDAINEGSPNAAYHLCNLLTEHEHGDEAEQIWRQEVAAGNPAARGWLAKLLEDDGRLSEATNLRRHGLNTDGSSINDERS